MALNACKVAVAALVEKYRDKVGIGCVQYSHGFKHYGSASTTQATSGVNWHFINLFAKIRLNHKIKYFKNAPGTTVLAYIC